MREILPDCVEKDIKVLSNAGGVNVEGCAAAIARVARELGLQGKVKIGVVTGDDVLDKLDSMDRPEASRSTTWTPASRSPRSATKSSPPTSISEPLRWSKRSAKVRNIIVGGRLTDTGLTLAPLDARIRLDVRRLGQHLGRNDRRPHHRMRCPIARRQLPVRLADRFPTWRISASRSSRPRPTADSSSPNTKAPAAASMSSRSKSSSSTRWATRIPTSRPTSSPISRRSSSQTPARTASSVFGITGHPKTDFYKVSIAYSDGWKAVGTLVYSWPDAYEKAQAADKILRERLDNLGLKFDVILTEFVGVNATHGHPAHGRSRSADDIPEVQLRIGVRGHNKADVERFTKEIAPLILTGPPGVTGFAGGRPKVEEIMAYFPALIPKSLIETKVDIVEA